MAVNLNRVATQVMSTADAHVFTIQINALLADLMTWQKANPQINDPYVSGMIDGLAHAAHNGDCRMRGVPIMDVAAGLARLHAELTRDNPS